MNDQQKQNPNPDDHKLVKTLPAEGAGKIEIWQNLDTEEYWWRALARNHKVTCSTEMYEQLESVFVGMRATQGIFQVVIIPPPARKKKK